MWRLFIKLTKTKQLDDTQNRRKRTSTHEWAHEWVHEWPHESTHESTHDGWFPCFQPFKSEIPPVLLGIPWPALGGPLRNHFWKKKRPQPYWGEIILEMLWTPQMPWIIGFGASQPYSRREFQETLWERFRGLSGVSPEFFRKVPAVLGVSALQGLPTKHPTKVSTEGPTRGRSGFACPVFTCSVLWLVRGKRSHRARNPEKFKVTKKWLSGSTRK